MIMIALILAAGYGTRLYPLTREIPKALLPVRGRPILEHLIDKLTASQIGVEKIVLVSNHKYAQKFQEWASPLRKISIAVLDDGSTSEHDRLGSMGDMAFAIRAASLESQDLLAIGSDNLFEDDLKEFTRFARGKAPAVTLGVYRLPDPSQASRYGVLTVEEKTGKVLAFEEKPAQPASALISTAVYFFPRNAVSWVLEYVGSSQSADTLGSFVHWLLTKESVFAYPFSGSWFDIGDIASYTHAQESFA